MTNKCLCKAFDKNYDFLYFKSSQKPLPYFWMNVNIAIGSNYIEIWNQYSISRSYKFKSLQTSDLPEAIYCVHDLFLFTGTQVKDLMFLVENKNPDLIPIYLESIGIETIDEKL